MRLVIVAERLRHLHQLFQIVLGSPQCVRRGLTEMPDDDLQRRILVEYAGRDESERMGQRLQPKSQRRARQRNGVVLEERFDDRGLYRRRMDVDRHVELGGAL